MLGLDVNIKLMQEDEWFVKWVSLSLISVYCTIDLIICSFISNIVTRVKKCYFEHFSLKFPAIIEIIGLRLSMFLIRKS